MRSSGEKKNPDCTNVLLIPQVCSATAEEVHKFHQQVFQLRINRY